MAKKTSLEYGKEIERKEELQKKLVKNGEDLLKMLAEWKESKEATTPKATK